MREPTRNDWIGFAVMMLFWPFGALLVFGLTFWLLGLLLGPR